MSAITSYSSARKKPLKKIDSENRPIYLIFAGCNGCGKSTLYNSAYSDSSDFPRVNSDEALKAFNGNWRLGSDRMKADRITVKQVREYFSQKISFCQETTLCGKSIIQNISLARNEGYDINLYYVGVESAELAKERIKNRVANGGHGIPDKDVDRRYLETVQKMKAIWPMCDKVFFFDNTVNFIHIAYYQDGDFVQLVPELPNWMNEIVACYPVSRRIY